MGLNSKGQASITDALYFLVIVSVLAVFLFVFGIGYGVNVLEDVERQYGTEFAASAFKTILYSSTPRIEGIALEETNEIDYLLASVKEDFADNQKLDRTKGVLANNVTGIMEPLKDDFDYVFYVYIPEGGGAGTVSGFVYLLFSMHDRVLSGERIVDPDSYVPGTSVYLCEPNISAADSMHNLDLLLTKVGSISQSTIPVRLIRLTNLGRDSENVKGRIGLAMWISTSLGTDAADNFSKLNCVACWTNNSNIWTEENRPDIKCPEKTAS